MRRRRASGRCRRGATRLSVTIPDRAFVPDFKIANYPVQGWIEKWPTGAVKDPPINRA
jgi:hypothetical protein